MVRVMAVDRLANRALEEASLRAFEGAVRRLVEERFDALCEATREQVGEIGIPYIGGTFNPRSPMPGYRIWWSRRGSPRLGRTAKPVLSAAAVTTHFKDIRKMQSDFNPLLVEWGQYAEQLRSSTWNIRQAKTFEWFCHRWAGAEF